MDTFQDIDAAFNWVPMIRAGVKLGKFRMGAEYNFVPKSNLQSLSITARGFLHISWLKVDLHCYF